MSLHPVSVANGLRTDHPVPDLPFVDDSHLPLDDPQALEAIGRHRSEGRWGRWDQVRDGGGWVAFTTDADRSDLAWCVRWHPDHGRSVQLYRDEDAAGVHMDLWGPPLLFRAGGYWWDGTTWYRPAQVWDRAGEQYARRPVPAGATVTAGDLLAAGGGQADGGRLLPVGQLDLDAPPPARWIDELAMWAAYRQDQPDQLGHLPLSACVVKLTAPELTGDELVGMAKFANIAGIAASTLRSYIARGEGAVPLPQAVVSGRPVWSRPVAEDWAEQRRRSSHSVDEAVSSRHDRSGTEHPVGVTEVWNWFTRLFFTSLWEHPRARRRWALRWRNPAAVRDIADDLGWDVAANLDRIVPTADLAVVLRHAVLDDFASGQQLADEIGGSRIGFYGLSPQIARTLDWLIRHQPHIAAIAIGEIIGDAERRLGIPREDSERSLQTALALDGKLDQDARDTFLTRVFTPTPN